MWNPRLAKALRTDDAIDLVQQARQSPHVADLRQFLRSRFTGRRCIIIGSAPNSRIPDLTPNDRVFCVNASGWLAARAGIARPDLTVIVGWTLRPVREVRRATIDAMRGLETDNLVFVESGAPEEEARSILADIGFQYQTFLKIDAIERAAIMGEAWGQEIALGRGTKQDDRPSNGVFAAALAIWADAEELVLCGFSLGGGKAYMQGDTPRKHLAADRQFFELSTRLTSRVRTTSEELQRLFAIPLAR